MEENIRYVKVFTPYHERYHLSYFFYYTDELGELEFGTVVQTRMKLGIIIDTDVPEDNLPNTDIYCLGGLADEKQIKMIEKEWWNVIKELHAKMNNIGKKKLWVLPFAEGAPVFNTSFFINYACQILIQQVIFSQIGRKISINGQNKSTHLLQKMYNKIRNLDKFQSFFVCFFML